MKCDSNSSKTKIFAVAKKLHELINMAEKLAFEQGHYLSVGLIGDCCRLCKTCVGFASGAPCRHPLKVRPSMEAMRIDVIATLKKVKVPTAFSANGEMRWTGLFLL